MKFANILGVALAAIVAFALLAPVSRADEANQLTKLTFSEPVQIPGNRVLPSGAYVFRLLGNNAFFGNVVQIYNAKESHLYITTLTSSAYRSTVTDRTALTVSKSTRAHSPVALMKWFYPGKKFGETFIYSNRKLWQFREAGTENVLATPASFTS